MRRTGSAKARAQLAAARQCERPERDVGKEVWITCRCADHEIERNSRRAVGRNNEVDEAAL